MKQDQFLTTDEIGCLFEVCEKFTTRPTKIMNLLDKHTTKPLNVQRLKPQMRKGLLNVAKEIEDFEAKKYNVSKARILAKLEK